MEDVQLFHCDAKTVLSRRAKHVQLGGKVSMSICKTMLVAVLLASFGINSAAVAQSAKMSKKAAATSPRQDPYLTQNFAAMKKSTADPAFKAALNDARAAEAQQILVRNGAYPKIVLLIEKKPAFVGSSPLPQLDLNGGAGGPWFCYKWQAVPHYYSDGAFWYYTMACLAWASLGGPALPITFTE